VIGLARAAEGPRQAEGLERRLGYALDSGRLRRLATSVRIVRKAADLDRMLWRAVAPDADQVQLQSFPQDSWVLTLPSSRSCTATLC
jgi:hypothetical protein